MGDREALKETYRLWREYLKRSHEYKAWCEKIRNAAQGKIQPMGLAEKCKFFSSGKHLVLSNLYSLFADVYMETFDKWWEGEKKAVYEINNFVEEPTIINYIDRIESHIDWTFRYFERMGEDITQEGFKQIFKIYMSGRELAGRGEKKDSHILFINPAETTQTEAAKAISKKIKKQKKQDKRFSLRKRYDFSYRPTLKKLHLAELQRYLTAYDLHVVQGFTIPEVIKKHGTRVQKSGSSALLVMLFERS